jgi:hypothetical protein
MALTKQNERRLLQFVASAYRRGSKFKLINLIGLSETDFDHVHGYDDGEPRRGAPSFQ